MNAKDLNDVGDVIYWLAAIRNDLESLRDGSLLNVSPMEYTLNALRCLGEAERTIGNRRFSRMTALSLAGLEGFGVLMHRVEPS